MTIDKAHEIRKIIESITPKEHEVLKTKFGITLSEHTPPEEIVGALNHITREKIQAIEQEALQKLRYGTRPDEDK